MTPCGHPRTVPAMADPTRERSAPGADAVRPRCAACGGVLGVYERLLWRRPDASVVACGWLEARTDACHAHPGSAFFHAACRPDLAGAA